MTRGTISDDVREFIRSSVPSVPYLEALLLLRSEPGACWDAQRLARRLYLSETTAATILAQLAANEAAQSCEVSDALRYHPQTPELATMIDRLAACYADNLVAISKLIHARG